MMAATGSDFTNKKKPEEVFRLAESLV